MTRYNKIASYKNIAKWFDENRSRDLFEKAWLDRAVEKLNSQDQVLDLGCGMGEPIASYFIKKGFNLVGIDSCSELLQLAKKRLPGARFLLKDMRGLSLNSKFSLIIAWNSFFHLKPEDQRKMFSVFCKHLKDKGLLMFTTGPKAGEVWSNNGGENLYHASFDPTEYQTLLEQNKFQIIDYKINDPDCNNHSVWLAQYHKK